MSTPAKVLIFLPPSGGAKLLRYATVQLGETHYASNKVSFTPDSGRSLSVGYFRVAPLPAILALQKRLIRD
jgi:hypothetical protein